MLNRFVLAAAFARSNLGCLPREPHRGRQHFSTLKNIDEAVIYLCSDVIESDDAFETFVDEAESWLKTWKSMSDLQLTEEISRIHPDHKQYLIGV